MSALIALATSWNISSWSQVESSSKTCFSEQRHCIRGARSTPSSGLVGSCEARLHSATSSSRTDCTGCRYGAVDVGGAATCRVMSSSASSSRSGIVGTTSSSPSKWPRRPPGPPVGVGEGTSVLILGTEPPAPPSPSPLSKPQPPVTAPRGRGPRAPAPPPSPPSLPPAPWTGVPRLPDMSLLKSLIPSMSMASIAATAVCRAGQGTSAGLGSGGGAAGEACP
mmetsp:Transcript_43861/g.124168  ORF Transcript_43861/g.124168 Transcript_43861/m.124168 type:complete len:223 (-) Transcript_43861:21-689(-)